MPPAADPRPRPPAPEAAGDTVRVLLAGGGLANGLVALALVALRPEAHVTILEAGPEVGGDHTWSFHATDLEPAAAALVTPLVAARWADQAVRFPAHARRLETPYASATSAKLRAALRERAGPRLCVRTRARAAALDANGVTLDTGERIEADLVIDGRGQAQNPHLRLGWQKFVGVELETPAPHGVERPLIMDATVPQLDGYRFLYLLPFSPTRLLVEDTRYSDGAELDDADVEREALAYAAANGWRTRAGSTPRRERGVLPIALAFDAPAFWREVRAAGVPVVGLRAGLFHAVTGYSLPHAARTALAIAAVPKLRSADVLDAIARFGLDDARAQGFGRMLSRMLFKAARPGERFRVLERFYRLPRPLIERFYAGRITAPDKLRILAGRPPVSLRAALPCLLEQPFLSKAAS